MRNLLHGTTGTHHLIADNATKLSSFLAKKIGVSVDDAVSLIQLGSVYHKAVDPERDGLARQFEDIYIAEGDYVRVYPNTHRYDTSSINWRERILYECDDYVVLNKPAGIPCCPTVGNYHENVAECVRKCVGLPKLYQPHRLDSDTSGIMVYGKTPSFNTNFHAAMVSRNFYKRYRLLIAHIDVGSLESTPVVLPTPGDKLTHFMENSTSQPRILYNESIPQSKLCEAQVLNRSKTLTMPLDMWRHRVNIWRKDHNETMVCGDASDKLVDAMVSWTDIRRKYALINKDIEVDMKNSSLSLCELELELITGRTHQLRAQVLQSGSGNFIAGDEIYCPPLEAGPSRLPPEMRSLHQMLGSPFLALQAYALGTRQEHESVVSEQKEKSTGNKPPRPCPLNGKTFELQSAFWSPLFRTDYFS